MGILDKIKDIETEIARTQKNKATEHHMGLLKARYKINFFFFFFNFYVQYNNNIYFN